MMQGIILGDFMKNAKIIKIISVILSVVLSVALAISLASATLISVARDYFSSQEFDSMVYNTDLSTMKFLYNGEKMTLEKFVKDYVTEKIENHIQNNPLSNFTDFLFPIFDSITDFTVDKALSSEFIDTTVKGEVSSIIDYFLYSDADEAKDRIKNGVTLDNNVALNPENTDNYEDRIKAEVKLAVFKYIEEESGKSCDEIIVLMSKDNISSLKTISFVLFALLLIVSIPIFPGNFIAVALSMFIFNGQLNSFVNGLKSSFAGNEDLISYQFIKPLTEAYTPYADRAQSIGIILLVISVAAFVVIYFMKKKK